jgi:5-(carboxyamino)imidazole ribonucleotide synthase
VASPPLAPGAAIGILGGGQLGRMLAMAAARLGLDVVILTPEPDAPASRVAAATILADYADPAALTELAARTEAVTYEFENVPAAAVEVLQRLGARVAPGALALATAQDRVAEKRFFNGCGFATAPFHPVDGPADIVRGLERVGAPALLKTRREGYDGKGQTWVADAGEAEAAFERIGAVPAVLEGRVDFTRELSVIAVRGSGGQVAAYPLTENRHENGVLRRSLAPAPADAATHAAALRIAEVALAALGYVGVAGIELFDTPDGLKVNEFAPRVHNSGHWTLDGCQVDQFEQHIRAVAGWPLGPTTLLAREVEMLNLLGEEAAGWADLAADPSARLWLYGKREIAPGRKMGHVNRLKPA